MVRELLSKLASNILGNDVMQVQLLVFSFLPTCSHSSCRTVLHSSIHAVQVELPHVGTFMRRRGGRFRFQFSPALLEYLNGGTCSVCFAIHSAFVAALRCNQLLQQLAGHCQCAIALISLLTKPALFLSCPPIPAWSRMLASIAQHISGIQTFFICCRRSLHNHSWHRQQHTICLLPLPLLLQPDQTSTSRIQCMDMLQTPAAPHPVAAAS